jgi:putative ABC transport system substrate-binding protein
MRRRDFITLLGVTAAAWPPLARAQQPAMPVIGYLAPTRKSELSRLSAFREGLGAGGYVEGSAPAEPKGEAPCHRPS